MDNGLIPEHSIISNIYLPFIEVTSVNGMTGDVVVSLTLEDFKANTFYKKGTAILHNGSLYYAKADFTSSNTFSPSDWDAPTFVQEQADWAESDNTKSSYIKNKPALATVATSGAYGDLSGTPNLATVATSGAYSDLTGTPNLATVATSGAYSDLSGTPSLATVATSGAYADLTGIPSLATVATSGSYTDLTDQPTIPTISQLLDLFYPVGSYYETSDASFNPNTAWGGTWVEDTKGRVTVAKADSGTFVTLGGTGGSETHRHDFKVGMVRYYGTAVGMESTDNNTWGAYSYSQSKYAKSFGTELTNRTHTRNTALQTSTATLTESTQYTVGDTDTASDVQPYIVVKRWHRTA